MSRLPLESSGKILFQVSYQTYPVFILYMHFALHYAHWSVEVTVNAVSGAVTAGEGKGRAVICDLFNTRSYCLVIFCFVFFVKKKQ